MGSLPPSSSFELVFLGSGGGRFATVTQKRHTGGIRILGDKVNVYLDPGPGGLIYSLEAGLDPQKLTGVLVSHCHPDHCNDAEILIEAMTRGMTRKKGVLAAANSVLHGNSQVEPGISKYHQGMPTQVIACKPDVEFSIDNTHVVCAEARHTDPDAVGFRFKTPALGDFAYTSDSEYFEGMCKAYKDLRLLLLCVLRPTDSPWKGHMTTDDATKIIGEANPKMAVLTHFGMQMIFRGPEKEARLVEEKTGVPTVAAQDGMHVVIADKINVQTPKKQRRLNEFGDTT
jgi:phosphoribosyl 1,2-cyclic phosphodiesterase